MTRIIYDNRIPDNGVDNNVSNVFPEQFLKVIVENIDTLSADDRWFDNNSGWYLDGSMCWTPNVGSSTGCTDIDFGSDTIESEYFRGYAVPYNVHIKESVFCLLNEDIERFSDNVKKLFVPKIVDGVFQEFYSGSFAQSNAAISTYGSYLLRSDSSAGGHDAPTVIPAIPGGLAPKEGLGVIAENIERCSGGKGIIWMNTKHLAYFSDFIHYIDDLPYFNGNLIIASPYIDDHAPYPYGGVAPAHDVVEPYIYATSPATMLIGYNGTQFLEDFGAVPENNRVSRQLFGFGSINYGCCKVAVRLDLS